MLKLKLQNLIHTHGLQHILENLIEIVGDEKKTRQKLMETLDTYKNRYSEQNDER